MKAIIGIFEIDCYENAGFVGYHFGEDWNGWAVPYFEKEEVDRLAQVTAKFPGATIHYNSDNDTYECTYLEGETDTFPAERIQTVHGLKKVYGIGTRCWTWWNSTEEHTCECGAISPDCKEIKKGEDHVTLCPECLADWADYLTMIGE